jgi:uroporphyrinogen decarboxylase
MNGRERVRAALTFSSPDRPPRDLWALPYVSLFRQEELDAVLQEWSMDIQRPERSPGSGGRVVRAVAQVGTYTDDWGSVWQVGEPGVVGEVKRPALADWSRLGAFQPPWHLIRQRDLAYINRSCDESEGFMLSDVTARPFERLQFLRGTQDLFVDLAYDTAEFRALLGMVHDFYLEDIRSWCRSRVDGILFMDDWGTRRSLLIHPDTWRAVFKPLYRDYCDLIHGAGKFAFFHSDGHTEAIYGDLIEVGIDAINSQLFTMDIEGLAARYRGQVTFWGEIDRQHVMPFGSTDEVREAVLRVRRALDDGSGGVIAQCEWGKDNPRENVEAVFAAWL